MLIETYMSNTTHQRNRGWCGASVTHHLLDFEGNLKIARTRQTVADDG